MKKNNQLLICTLIALGFILICENGCKKEENNQTSTLATIVTDSVTNITDTSATCGGNITNDGGSTISARGVCWSTNKNPTINDDSLTLDGTGKGIFTSKITGLSAGTTYYVRAYAFNSVGVTMEVQYRLKQLMLMVKLAMLMVILIKLWLLELNLDGRKPTCYRTSKKKKKKKTNCCCWL